MLKKTNFLNLQTHVAQQVRGSFCHPNAVTNLFKYKNFLIWIKENFIKTVWVIQDPLRKKKKKDRQNCRLILVEAFTIIVHKKSHIFPEKGVSVQKG